ncbi:hypothetical protein ACFE04_022253 [Oxalis oulophora]
MAYKSSSQSQALDLDSIIEERIERVVSLNGRSGEPNCLKVCNFLKPSGVSNDEQVISSPPLRIPTSDLQDLSLNVQFKGWQPPPINWKSWVLSMHSKHRQTWEKAGIEKSILSSVYRIVRQNKTIYEVADKWCPKTNTFIFPSGESTVTLEDIIVLGGYSVLGDSVLIPLDDDLSRRVEILIDLFRIVKKTSGQHTCTHNTWIQYFIGYGTKLEHEAFLVLWLLRFVFPKDYVKADVFPIAIRLSEGCRLAFGPAVLAHIYKDLGLLKQYILSKRADLGNNHTTLILWAPFQLVQLWVWERFPTLSPTPGLIKHHEPRVARWHNIDKSKFRQVKFSVNKGEGHFKWRPYAAALSNWQPPEFYREECSKGRNLKKAGKDTVDEDKLTIEQFLQTIDSSVGNGSKAASCIQSHSSTTENVVNLDVTSMVKNIETDTQPQTSRGKMEDRMEDRNLRNFQSFVGEREQGREEFGADINITKPIMKNIEKDMQPQASREKMDKSMEDGNSSSGQRFVGEIEEAREVGVDTNMKLMMKYTKKDKQPETSIEKQKRSVEAGNSGSMQSSVRAILIEQARTVGFDINMKLMMKITEKDTQPGTSTEIRERNMEDSNVQNESEGAREDGGHCRRGLYDTELEARILNLEKIFAKLKADVE